MSHRLPIRSIIEAIEDLLVSVKQIDENNEGLAWDELHEHIQKADELQKELEQAKSRMLFRAASMETLEMAIRGWMKSEPERKIHAIKFVREVTQWGLKEAKDFVEANTAIQPKQSWSDLSRMPGFQSGATDYYNNLGGADEDDDQ